MDTKWDFLKLLTFTDTANYRYELFFYHKCDFQQMVDSTFQKMKSEKKIKVRKSQKVFSILPNPQKNEPNH